MTINRVSDNKLAKVSIVVVRANGKVEEFGSILLSYGHSKKSDL